MASNGAELAQVLVEQRPHLLVGVRGDVGGGRRRRPGQRHDLVAELGQPLHRAGDRDVEALDARDHLRPAQQRRPGVGAHELLPGRLLRRECIGLVLNPPSDTRHTSLPFIVQRCMDHMRPDAQSSSWRCWRHRPANGHRVAKPGVDQRWSTRSAAVPARSHAGNVGLFADWRPSRSTRRDWNWPPRPTTRVQRSEISQAGRATLAVACMRNKAT